MSRTDPTPVEQLVMLMVTFVTGGVLTVLYMLLILALVA
jgi:hypothetical protein